MHDHIENESINRKYDFEYQTTLLNNISAVSGACIYFVYAVLFSVYSVSIFYPVLIVYVISIPSLLLTLVLNKLKKHLLAGIIMNLASSIPVFINSYFFYGCKVGNHYFLLFFILLPIFTLARSNKLFTVSISFLNIVFFYLVTTSTRTPKLAMHISDTFANWVFSISLLSSLIIIVLVSLIHHQMVIEYDRLLNEKTKNLEIALSQVNLLATVYGLTNILNRRYMDELIEEEIIRSARYQLPFSLIMLDLDYFKKINDQYGHFIGDDVLVSLSNLISSSIRSTDFFGRWGGEEFLIALPQTEMHDAIKIAEKIRIIIEDYDHPIVQRVTASFGVTEWIPSEEKELLYKRVDELMYMAKRSGRNTVFPKISFDEDFQ